jgi:Zn ribbon nucleic-acid-binding protein
MSILLDTLDKKKKRRVVGKRSPTISDAQDLMALWKKDAVIIFHIDIETGEFGVVSYGKDKSLCRKAKNFADRCFDILKKVGF